MVCAVSCLYLLIPFSNRTFQQLPQQDTSQAPRVLPAHFMDGGLPRIPIPVILQRGHPVHLTVPTAHPLLQPTRASVLPCPSTALPGSKDKKPPKSRRGALCRRSLSLSKAFTVLREAENNARGPGAHRLKTADKLGPSPAAGLSSPEARGADREQDLRLALLSRPLPA